MSGSGQPVLLRDREDTIAFTLAAEDVVVNETVKIVASVSGMVTRDKTEASLRSSIREMLDNFIAAPWQISNLIRSAHASGLEVVALTATARVPETENRALDKRRQDASRPEDGLTISSVTTDLSFPADLIEETEQKLRIEIVRKAKLQCEALSEALGRTCRISRIAYGNEANNTMGQHSARQYAAATAAIAYGAGFATTEDAAAGDIIGNAQKLTMTASITLAVSP